MDIYFIYLDELNGRYWLITWLITFPVRESTDTDSKMHTSRYAEYHINGNRDYITDGEESHRAPSDRTVSEYIVANEHTTMVMYLIPIAKTLF